VTADSSAPDPNAEPPDASERWTVPISILAGLAVIAAIWAGQDVLIPLVFGALMSYALDPLHRRFVALGMPRGLAAVLLLVAVLGIAIVGAVALRNQASTFVNRLPALTQKLRQALRDGRGAFGSTVQPMQQAANELKKAADESIPRAAPGITRVLVEDPPMRLSDLLWKGTMGAIGFAAQATIVLFLVYYMLASGDRYKRKLLEIAGPSRFRKRLTLEIVNGITAQMERFLIARVLITGIVGVATGLGLWALGMPQPVMWGIAAGVLNNIPYLGPATVVGAATLTALVQFGTLEMAGAVCGVSASIAMLEGFLVTPWIMGRAGRMDTGVVFVSLMFWGWLWGIWGLLFAVPIMMAIKAACDHIPEFNAVSELLRE
jgi:predicted PurR-regulated permease PerM